MNSEFILHYKEFIFPTERTLDKTEVLQPAYWSKFVEHKFEEEPLKKFFESLTEDECKTYFQFGIDCILCFVQANFTGPELPKHFEEFFSNILFTFEDDCTKFLSRGYEEDVNVNTKYPLFLCAARYIFKCCDMNPVINKWWQLRSVLIHQQLFDHLSPLLFSEANVLQSDIQSFDLPEDLKAELELEQLHLYILYRQISKAETHLNTVRNILQIDYELVGKIGKRTKYQQTEVAQLTLQVNTKPAFKLAESTYEVPKSVALQDDLLLENIEFINKDSSVDNLSVTEQKFILMVVQLMLISQPQDNLYYEEIKPFIDFLLNQSNTWTIRVVILLLRCKFEAKHKRTIERCLLQAEELVNSIKKETPISFHRIYDVYNTSIPPIWKIEEQLGNILLSLGLVKAALDIFLQLQNWEAVITCYNLLKLRHKAAEVIQQQLNIKPSVKLWCYLGDANDDINCYQKAWELSNERSFLPQHHWGMFYYQRHQYQECILHLEKSVTLNSLQPNAWLYLGYAALEIENWATAATAYRHYTSLEPGSFETWNNLAKAYIKLGNKRAAHQALHDALRCNYENWKVWDNLMVVSADIGHFSDIIRSYHRILDVKEKHLDIEVLGVLVQSVCSDIKDSDGNLTGRLLPRTRELFGRITSIYPADGQLWELYSKIAPDQLVKTQRLQRALKGLTNPEWEKDPEKCIQVLKISKKLLECALNNEIEPTNIILNSIKLNIRSIITVMKKLQYSETTDLVKEIDELLPELLKKIENGLLKNN